MSNILSLINFIKGARYPQLTMSHNKKEYWEWLESENAMLFILAGSSDVGGAPILNILNYLYRGHTDF